MQCDLPTYPKIWHHTWMIPYQKWQNEDCVTAFLKWLDFRSPSKIQTSGYNSKSTESFLRVFALDLCVRPFLTRPSCLFEGVMPSMGYFVEKLEKNSCRLESLWLWTASAYPVSQKWVTRSPGDYFSRVSWCNILFLCIIQMWKQANNWNNTKQVEQNVEFSRCTRWTSCENFKLLGSKGSYYLWSSIQEN